MRVPVVGIGAGGHAKVLIEILRAGTCYEVAGLLDPRPDSQGQTVLGVPMLGGDSELPRLIAAGIRHFFVGIGSVGDSSARKRLYEHGLALGMEAVSSIHPSAIISPSVRMGHGNMIMAGVVINACTILGNNIIVNTGAVVDHDCWLGDHVHVATGAKLSGTVRVGAGAHIGAGAVIRHNISIGEGTVVGAGAAVIKDVAVNEVVVGVPARPLRRRS
jgi:sugar O-acyltransferase (sialic acid O-acetyltransferase NeuD family)